MKRLLFLLVVLSASSVSFSPRKEKGWISLFNGKDLNGWIVKFTGYEPGVNYKNTFRVEDGLLKVRYDQYETFKGEYGHLFYKNSYSRYKLRIEYRFVGEQVPGGEGWAYRNSGVMLHGQTPESMEKDQQFPTSIEVQFLGGNGKDERSTLNLCTPGTNVMMEGKLITDHCINSSSKTYHDDQWVTAEIEVCGDSIIKHIIDGQVVLQYNQPQLDERDPTYNKLLPADGNKLLKSGTISLQAESHPVDFRKVELLNLGEECY
jgi:hypothetical protein